MTDAVFTATADAIASTNPLDTTEFFVRQQYLDLLNREPDQAGFDYWSAQINQCNGDAACIRARRISVAAAFFIEQEFQQTGFLVYRFYKASFESAPTYAQYVTDRAILAGGEDIDQDKILFAEDFVQRADFVARYPLSQSAGAYVDTLIRMVSLGSQVDLSPHRAELINEYNGGANQVESRMRALLKLVGFAEFVAAEYNKAFVLEQYFAYLGREPDAQGYLFWLNVLNNRQPNNYRGMVCSFITSTEYQKRFSAIITHSNAECGQ
jgi:hypothetical protein